jgi:hypothetical protein
VLRSIGRHTQLNDIVLPEQGVSRQHCSLCLARPSGRSLTTASRLLREEKRFCLRDNGSTTGTFLFLRESVDFHLFPGCMLRAGGSEFVVVDCNEFLCELLFFEGVAAGKRVKVTPSAPLILGREPVELPEYGGFVGDSPSTGASPAPPGGAAGQQRLGAAAGRCGGQQGAPGNNTLDLSSDTTLSVLHAQVYFHSDAWFVTDLGSRNGTSCRLSPEQQASAFHELFDGDVFAVGSTRLRARLVAGGGDGGGGESGLVGATGV